MIDFEHIQALHSCRKWREMATTLEQGMNDLTGMHKWIGLVNIATAYRGLGESVLAGKKLRQALEFSEVHSNELTAMNWNDLARELETVGLLHEAYRALSHIGADDRTASQNVMIDRLKAAFAIEQELATSNVRIVSLGQSCIPDDIVRRWGLGFLYSDGPFSGGVFFGDGVTKTIEDNFARYYELAAYQINNTASGFSAVSLPAYHTMFNHEVGEDWTANDLGRLRNLYVNRISNFRSLAGSQGCLFVFVRHSHTDLHRLQNALDRVASAKRRLLVLDFCSAPADALGLGDWARYLECSFPYGTQENVWFLPKYFNTDVGFEFEKSLVTHITEEIRRIT